METQSLNKKVIRFLIGTNVILLGALLAFKPVSIFGVIMAIFAMAIEE